MSVALSVRDLVKTWGSLRAVDDLTLDLPRGEIVGLIGPNGAGKSTWMGTVAGLFLPDAGTIAIAGRDVTRDPALARALCGLAPQEFRLFDYLTPAETLRCVAEVRGCEAGGAESDRWLRVTGLDAHSGRLVRDLSGGMRRKLAVAAALLHRPPLAILDESFTGLDPESTRALEQELLRLRNEGGTVLLSSHILEQLERLCDRIVVIRKGRLVENLDRDALRARIPSDFATLTDLYLARTHDGAG